MFPERSAHTSRRKDRNFHFDHDNSDRCTTAYSTLYRTDSTARALMEMWMWRTGKQRRRDAIHDFPFFPCTSASLARRSTLSRCGRRTTDGRDNLSDACEDSEWASTLQCSAPPLRDPEGGREGARQTEREKTLLNAEHDFRITEQARDRADGDSEVLRLRLGGKS